MNTQFTRILLVGATGDLARTKLYPSLHHLFLDRVFPHKTQIIGIARKELSNDQLYEIIRESVPDSSDEFLEMIQYQSLDYTDTESFVRLSRELGIESHDRIIIYLAIPPQGFIEVIHCIIALKKQYPEATIRLVIEKPFGQDLATAQELNTLLLNTFRESEIYRIDHYLGKETIQNILALRFGNSLFEPVLNNRYVESIHIQVFETRGIDDRAFYFDQVGITKDILQNHILQIMALLLMESPARMEAEFIRDEKYKVLRSLRTLDLDRVFFGQYTRNNDFKGYLEEVDINPNSKTETYVSLEALVDNPRWEGVPILIQTGKRMPKKKAEIRIVFKPTFKYFVNSNENCNPERNELIIEIQPKEQVYIKVNAKFPGRGMCIQPVCLNFTYEEAFSVPTKEAYTRLLEDVLEGDQSLFIRSDEIEAAWEYVTPLINLSSEERVIHPYPAGIWPKNSLDDNEGIIQKS